LLVVVQAQLWFGRGSLPKVAQLQRDIDEQKQGNQQASHQNGRLSAEIADLREGLEIAEGKARSELGMVKNNEIFVQTIF
jgi:cell division protein FtsB